MGDRWKDSKGRNKGVAKEFALLIQKIRKKGNQGPEKPYDIKKEIGKHETGAKQRNPIARLHESRKENR